MKGPKEERKDENFLLTPFGAHEKYQPTDLVGDRLTAGRQTLDLSTLDRILVPQPKSIKGLAQIELGPFCLGPTR